MTIRIVIEGIVQGVGFRQFIQSHALRLGLSGWVMNRSDGAVEALLCGRKDQIDEMIALCHQGPTSAEIDAVSVGIEEEEASVKGFLIIKEERY